MKPLYLILGAHHSQPPALSNSERETIYKDSYKPFLQLVYSYPKLPATLYYSGIVLEWLERHHTEFIDALSDLTKRKQVELLGGGFFEPVFPLIPKTDRIGQIERLTTHIRKHFGRRPRGAWIPFGIWDQRIASNLNSGGIEYTFLNADQIGLTAQERVVPFITEDQGKTITVFPIENEISAMLFRETPQKVINALKEYHRMPNHSVENVRPVSTLMFDTGRFSAAGDTNSEARDWFVAFVEELENNRDWLEPQIPARIHRRQRPLNRRWMPTSTISDLCRWLPGSHTEAAGEDQRSFRAMLEDFPSSARLYAKMQYTHVLVNQVRGDRSRKSTAREELWRGQCHYSYWDNNTGGVFRADLRKATYGALIEAEKTTREKGIFIPAVIRLDFDLDGTEEVLYQGNDFNAYVHRRGAFMFELDYLRRNWNYLDTHRRIPRTYHDGAARKAGYDDWPRGAFVDHLFEKDQKMGDFQTGKRRLFFNTTEKTYDITDVDKDHNSVTLECTCKQGGTLHELQLRKRFRFSKQKIDVEYTVVNNGMEPVSFLFGSETNLSFKGLDVAQLRINVRQGRRRQEVSPDAQELDSISELVFSDLHNNNAIHVLPTERPVLWSFPIEAVGYRWDHAEWYYQSNCSVLVWPIDLAAGESKEFATTLKFELLK